MSGKEIHFSSHTFTPNDEKFTWLDDVFLEYFNKWRESTLSRPGNYPADDRNKIFISSQTVQRRNNLTAYSRTRTRTGTRTRTRTGTRTRMRTDAYQSAFQYFSGWNGMLCSYLRNIPILGFFYYVYYRVSNLTTANTVKPVVKMFRTMKRQNFLNQSCAAPWTVCAVLTNEINSVKHETCVYSKTVQID